MSITDRIKSLLDNVKGEETNENETQPKDEGDNMSKKELQQFVEELNLAVDTKLKKKDLLKAIKESIWGRVWK